MRCAVLLSLLTVLTLSPSDASLCSKLEYVAILCIEALCLSACPHPFCVTALLTRQPALRDLSPPLSLGGSCSPPPRGDCALLLHDELRDRAVARLGTNCWCGLGRTIGISAVAEVLGHDVMECQAISRLARSSAFAWAR